MPYVIGIDTGGTFTDAFAADEHGRLAAAKTPSTPPDFAEGFLNAIDELAGDARTERAPSCSRDTGYIVHGTTSTLNALVTGDVADVGFLTTARARRLDQHHEPGGPLRRAGRRRGAEHGPHRKARRAGATQPHRRDRRADRLQGRRGRPAGRGRSAARRPRSRDRRRRGDRGLAAVVVPQPRARAAGSRADRTRRPPSCTWRCPARSSPRIREYARSVTTIMNTQVGPRLGGYLGPLEARAARTAGSTGSLLVMQGSGGCVSATDAPARAITTIGSVLTGGVVGCTRLAAALGTDRVISTDMGGTTFLVGLVVDGEPGDHHVDDPQPVHDQHADGRRAHDRRRRRRDRVGRPGGNLRVGPRSAGARPGPACYGDGGWEPTVTDADLRARHRQPGQLPRRPQEARRAGRPGGDRQGRGRPRSGWTSTTPRRRSTRSRTRRPPTWSARSS